MRQLNLALAVLITAAAVRALPAQDAAVTVLDAKTRGEIIDALSRELNRAYVFPDKAVTMERELRTKLSQHVYDDITDRAEFARLLTDHLQGVTSDKHLRVIVRGQRPAGLPANAPARPNEAFGEAKRLQGDVAYVEIRSFGFRADAVREQVRTVMSTAADAKALILDLRTNGGGDPTLVALVSSYLFGDEPVHLNSLYWRVGDRTDDFYTDPKVAGKKFGATKPVFVLTSGRTFSAAEEFSYNLQTRKRATIVGETTGGGAHPGGGASLPHGLGVFVPSGRAINPITKTNWEGTGVKPDVAVAADAALETAHKLALERIERGKN